MRNFPEPGWEGQLGRYVWVYKDLIGANFMRAGCESHDVYALDSWNDVMQPYPQIKHPLRCFPFVTFFFHVSWNAGLEQRDKQESTRKKNKDKGVKLISEIWSFLRNVGKLRKNLSYLYALSISTNQLRICQCRVTVSMEMQSSNAIPFPTSMMADHKFGHHQTCLQQNVILLGR
jgi:hypothetical protein